MSATATALATIKSMQAALSVISALALTNYEFASECTLTNQTTFDYIVVGGGSAGSVIASRLSENANYSVLLVEAGGYLPLQAELPGAFTLLPLSEYDYAYDSVNDNYTAQNLQGSVVSLTQGKALGGSSILNHMIHVQGNALDFQEWADISGDDAWNYENILPYFIKMEQLLDESLLNSSYAAYHGTSGCMKISRQTSSTNEKLLSGFEEIGCNTILDDSGEASLGYNQPLFNIADGKRQSNALAYLGLPVMGRDNLYVALSTTATKIVIEDGVATGVQMVDSSGNTLVINANKEVIVTAGAIGSPHLLMLSGVGPKADLEALDIPCLADLPVGENFQDHLAAALVYQMEASDATTPPSNPHMFPVDTITGYAAVNSSQTYPDYQTINLVFPHDSSAMLQLCGNVFKYTEEICDKWYAASAGRTTLFVVHNLLKPKSRGVVKLTSADYTVPPAVYTGAYSNSSDLKLMAECLEDFDQFKNGSYFTSVNTTLVDLGLCSDASTTSEFWECYAIAMSSTMWHYSGTCSMGSVVDSALKVKGIEGLRVADSSAMPTVPSGNINAAITVLAEKASDLILADCASS